MPLINGQKMACEPCIRGHRSTKCTHANERLMVPVRKPGRPLSSCPHPPNRNCGCASVTAAIPRKQKCRCGGSEPPGGHSAPILSTHVANPVSLSGRAPAAAPVDTMSPTRTTFRIQKNPHPPSAKASPAARKLSADPSAILDRIDPSQVNVLPAPTYAPHPRLPPPPQHSSARYAQPSNHIPATNGTPKVSFDYTLPATPSSSFVSKEEPRFHHNHHEPQPLHPGYTLPHLSTPNPHPHPLAANGVPSGPIAPSPVPTTISTPSLNGIAPSSCCSSRPQPIHPIHPPDAPSPTVSSSPNHTGNHLTFPSPSEGCCSQPRAQTQIPQPQPHPPSGGHAGVMSPIMPPFVQDVDPFPQYFQSQPTLYTYPPTLGTYLHPLQPAQWRQNMATVSFPTHQAPASPGTFDSPAVTARPPLDTGLQAQPESAAAAATAAGTSHACSCGPSCQCIGCAAHPYNDATQKYVRSAWDSMSDSNHNNNGQSSSTEHPYTNGAAKVATSPNGTHAHVSGAHNGQSAEGGSPPAAHTPSDTASTNDEQALSASDFFFVNYPFAGDSCGGDTASCPCGDDCQCLGCSIHNTAGNALPS